MKMSSDEPQTANCIENALNTIFDNKPEESLKNFDT